jgi:hypothetical protein
MAEAKAVGYLELNIAGFQEAISAAKKAMIGLAAFFAADKIKDFFVDGTKEAINFGNEMYKAGQRLGGFDPGKLLLVEKALQNAGLSASEAEGKVEQFLSERRDFSQMFGGAEKYAAALQESARIYGSQADILSSKSEAFAKVAQTMEEVGGKLKTFFLAAAGEFLEPLEAALEALDEIDLAGIGKSFGDGITKAVEVLAGLFKNGTFIEVLQTGLIVAVQTAIEYAVGGIKLLSAWLMSGFTDSISKVPWQDIGQSVLNGIKPLKDFLLTAIEKAIAMLAAGIAYSVRGLLNTLPDKLRKWLTGSEGKLENDLPTLISRRESDLHNAFAPYHDVSKSASNLFKTDNPDLKYKRANIFGDELSKKLNDLTGKIASASVSGSKLIETHSHLKKDAKVSQEALKPAESFTGIADSMAKIGGGGGFVRVGQSIAEREAIRSREIQAEQLKVQKAMYEQGKNTKAIKMN